VLLSGASPCLCVKYRPKNGRARPPGQDDQILGKSAVKVKTQFEQHKEL
jgi:hypothetical protein